jgi:hypothetical protein
MRAGQDLRGSAAFGGVIAEGFRGREQRHNSEPPIEVVHDRAKRRAFLTRDHLR